MMDAVRKIGPLRITPGRARMVQTNKSRRRYNRRPRVFQLAGRALGIYRGDLIDYRGAIRRI